MQNCEEKVRIAKYKVRIALKIKLCHDDSRSDLHGNVHEIVHVFNLGGIDLLCCCLLLPIHPQHAAARMCEILLHI